jgi:hypothetical protein
VGAAGLASVSGSVPYAMMLGLFVAFRTIRHTIRPSPFFDVLKARIIVWELVVEVFDAVAQMLGNALFNLASVAHVSVPQHNSSKSLTCCQGIITTT